MAEFKLESGDVKELTNGEMSEVRIIINAASGASNPSAKVDLKHAQYDVSGNDLLIAFNYWLDLSDFIGDFVDYDKDELVKYYANQLDGLDLSPYDPYDFEDQVPDNLKSRFEDAREKLKEECKFKMQISRKVIAHYESGQINLDLSSSEARIDTKLNENMFNNGAYDSAKEGDDLDFEDGETIEVDVKCSE